MSVSCIWCGRGDADSLEHIVPESLGCPAEFVLRQGVCERCNRKNGQLDRALLVPFELITVFKQIPRKKGKKPTIDGFASMSSSYNQDGPVLFINREKHAVTLPNLKKLSGTNAADPIKNFEFERLPNGTGSVSYNQELRFDPKAVRGLFKIAVEVIAFFEGLDVVRNKELDDVKDFVRDGRGSFRALLIPDQSPHYESYFAPCYRSPAGMRACAMTILGLGFICDFDPEFSGGELILNEMAAQAIGGQIVPNWPRKLWHENNARLIR